MGPVAGLRFQRGLGTFLVRDVTLYFDYEQDLG
jgi:hypothetical protein